MKRSGVQHRLTRVYLIQLLLISVATVMGVWATANIIEHVLVKQALIKEADHYWALLDGNPEQPRPNTRHLLGLLTSDTVNDSVPEVLSSLADGYQRVDLAGERPIVYIESRGSSRLYLVFDERRVSVLAFLFGILPLTGVLLVIYITSFLGWKKSRELLSPLVLLADRLRQTPVDTPSVARPELAIFKRTMTVKSRCWSRRWKPMPIAWCRLSNASVSLPVMPAMSCVRRWRFSGRTLSCWKVRSENGR